MQRYENISDQNKKIVTNFSPDFSPDFSLAFSPGFSPGFSPDFPPYLLDKLAQLPLSPKTGASRGAKTLQKRARAKYITKGITNELRKLDSDLQKSYLNTFFCANELSQVGKKITGKYCNNRWCIVCNRIRTAKLIIGYKEPLQDLADKRFVTISRPNVAAKDLREEIKSILHEIRLIQRALLKDRNPIIGIRKLECTYNPIRNDFHPHPHFILSGRKNAARFVEMWLNRNKTADPQAQDNRPADNDSIMELFKYFAKIITKDQVHIEALDTMFRAMYGLRVFQPMGISKNVSEDIEELQAEIYADLEERETRWSWIETDWIDKSTGECLTGYKPSEYVETLLSKIVT